MPNYIRATFEGGYYFFTLNTYRRRRLFLHESARNILREVIQDEQDRRPFEMVAMCLLPDHIHCVWKLPEGDADFSSRWSAIKGNFSRTCRRLSRESAGPAPPYRAPAELAERRAGFTPPQGLTRVKTGEVNIWQKRFWEHQIRDMDDLQRHVDYIHYNPLKHGWVDDVADWPWSTYHRYVKSGFYKHGFNPDVLDGFEGEFGEK